MTSLLERDKLGSTLKALYQKHGTLQEICNLAI